MTTSPTDGSIDRRRITVKEQKQYGYDELALVFSNLAKSAEKQINAEVSKKLDTLSTFFKKNSSKETGFDIDELVSSVSQDVSSRYPEVEKEGKISEDRGALRCATWGKKVSAIHKSILTRYKNQKEQLFEGKEVWVCEACGFIAISPQVPAVCPICKAPSSRFTKIRKEN